MKATTPMLIVIIQIMMIMISGCKQTTEPILKPELRLQLEDVSCTEAWIKLSANNLKFPATLSLIKDGNVAQTISLWGGGDTTLYVDSLLPKRTYKFSFLFQLCGFNINCKNWVRLSLNFWCTQQPKILTFLCNNLPKN